MESSSAAPPSQSVTYAGLTWTDVADPTSSDTSALGKRYGFHPLDLEECLTGRVTKVEDHGDHIFILLHFPQEGADGLVFSNRVSMFLGKDYLVTLHPEGCNSIKDLFETCRDDELKRASLMKSSTQIAYRIIDGLVGSVFNILDDIQGDLDKIEAVVFEEKKSQAGPINHARRQIAAMGRILFPLRLFLPELSRAQKFSKEDLSLYFSDLNHKLGMSSGEVDEMKEMLEIYKDTDFVTSTNRTNSVLAILTIIFTLTIPASVLSSIYGMNIPLPGGLATGPLDFAGTYSSLFVILILMAVPSLIMVWYFRRAGWF